MSVRTTWRMLDHGDAHMNAAPLLSGVLQTEPRWLKGVRQGRGPEQVGLQLDQAAGVVAVGVVHPLRHAGILAVGQGDLGQPPMLQMSGLW